MVSPRFIVVFLLSVLVCTISAKFVDNLSYDDLSSTLKDGPTMLIFTVGWCPHCKEVLPEIGVLAKAVKNVPGITVARVDGDAEPAIVSKFSVDSFPSFLYFPPKYSLKESKEGPSEFSDYRWAELMAEFVNNETMAETVKLAPRKKFLNWRKKVPYNKGKQPRVVREQEATPTPHPEGLDPITGADESGIEIRDPIILTPDNFDSVVNQEKEGIAVYFYTKSDFMQKEMLIEWRQASSAYTPKDHVTLAMMNVENTGNEAIAGRYDIDGSQTPVVAYFKRCDGLPKKKQVSLEECKKPVECDACDDTDKVIDFISKQMMVEVGLNPDSPTAENGADGEDVVTLTTEEYEKLIKEGKITPIDPDNPDDTAEDGKETVVEVPYEEGDNITETVNIDPVKQDAKEDVKEEL